MEAVAESPRVAVPVRLPEIPSIGEEELGQAVVRGFIELLHHSRERADVEIARGLEAAAQMAASELAHNGVLGDRSGREAPLVLLGTLYRFLGCRVSAWMEGPDSGVLRVDDCPLRRSLALVGVECRAVCARMRRGALESLPEPVEVHRSPGDPGCLLTFRIGEGNGR